MLESYLSPIENIRRGNFVKNNSRLILEKKSFVFELLCPVLISEMAHSNISSSHVVLETDAEIIQESEDVHETSFTSTQMFDTDELLLRLPSRKLMSSVGSKGTTTTLRKKKTIRSKSMKYRTVRMPRNANSEDILKKLNDEDVMDDDGHMTEDGKDVIRSMPVSLSGKIQALQHLSENQQASNMRLKYSTWFSSSITSSWNKFKRRVNNLAFYTALWKSAIKKIKGHFDLLTGKGWFEDTELYYGFYTNESISISDSTYYNMPYAYFLTSAVNYLLLLAIIAYSIARSYKTNYIEAGNENTFYFVTKIFCGWDYGITSKDAAVLKHKSLCNEFKENLTKFKDDIKKRKLYQQCRLFFWRLFTHLLVLALISASGYFVYFLSNTKRIELPLLADLTVPICISAANTLLPFIFSGIAYLEQYDQPQTNLYITMIRNMLLKVTNISMLCFYWAQKVIDTTKNEYKCWETFISQDIYRLVLVDFFFSLLFTLWFEIFWAMIYHFKIISRSPEFNIAANTLDLIYSQALCWLGLFYSPLMPLLMAVKLFIIFYVKWLSVLKTCQTSKKAWHAARTHTIFLFFLLVFFVLTATTVAVSIVFSQPSIECGPFRNFKSAYDVVLNMVISSKGAAEFLQDVLEFISKPGFITLILVTLCISAYYSRIVLIGHKEMVKLLKYQLAMEGQDKVFLLKLLNQVKSGKIFNNAGKTH
ncbi:TMC [Acanthosepion pharaonis]|uniref:TMC n=1 Tax=Acanthosepion pharaonis TaxID=158019 RepID=A0A812BHB6_ACAPH|nr:TMC [Sepia pharaonis]